MLIKLSSKVILLFTVHSIECTVPEQFSCYISWSKQSTDVLIQPSSALGKQAMWKGWKYKKLSIWKSLCICITKFCCSIKWKNLPKKCQQMSSIHPASNSCTHTRLTALSGTTTRVSRYQEGKTNLDFTEARDSEWQWYQLGHMQVCISLQTDNHVSNPPLSFLQTGCPSCRPTNSVKALKG